MRSDAKWSDLREVALFRSKLISGDQLLESEGGSCDNTSYVNKSTLAMKIWSEILVVHVVKSFGFNHDI